MTRRRSTAQVLAVALAVLGSTLGLGAAPASSEDSSLGSISGTVTGPDGVPVQGICVQAHDPDEPDLFQDVGFAQTGADGAYTLPDLPPGQYLVEFSSCGFGLNFVQEFYNDQAHAYLADLVSVD